VPASIEEEYRAAWGIATECRQECTLIGYDDRGRLIEPSMIRPRRPELSAEETLELIRAHCDSGLRYFTWALKRMPSIPEQAGYVREVQNDRNAHALVLAYVEGAHDGRAAVPPQTPSFDAASTWSRPRGGHRPSRSEGTARTTRSRLGQWEASIR
jgi:hypothetical protein